MTAHETYMRTALEAAGKLPAGRDPGGGLYCPGRGDPLGGVQYPGIGAGPSGPCGDQCHPPGLSAAGKLAAGRLCAVCDAGALSHVCRGDPQCPDQPGGIWGSGPQGPGVWDRCAISLPCLSPPCPIIRAGCWKPSAGQNWTGFSGDCGSGKRQQTRCEPSRQILHFSPDFPQVESLQTGRNMLKYGMSDVFAVSPFPLESGLSFDDRRQKAGRRNCAPPFSMLQCQYIHKSEKRSRPICHLNWIKNYLIERGLWGPRPGIHRIPAPLWNWQLLPWGVRVPRIAKTLSFKTPEGVVLIVAAGDAKVDNQQVQGEVPYQSQDAHPRGGRGAGGPCSGRCLSVLCQGRGQGEIWTRRCGGSILSIRPAAAPTAQSSSLRRSWNCSRAANGCDLCKLPEPAAE